MPFAQKDRKSGSPDSLSEKRKDNSDDECCGCWRRSKKSSQRSTSGPRTPEKLPPPPPPPLPPPPPPVKLAKTQSLEHAADFLNLQSKEREQVQKAIEEEMARRRLWATTIKKRRVADKFAAGPPGRSDYHLMPTPTPTPAHADAKEEFAPAMAPVEQVYFTTPAMMASMEKSACLDDQRADWLKRMQNPSAPPPGPKPIKPARDQQPESLTVDDETAKEIRSHTLVNMLERIMIQQTLQQQAEQHSEQNSSGRGSAKSKMPSEMTPEELIDLRRRNPTAWDDFVTANSVTAFGLAKPTAEDEASAKKRLHQSRNKTGSDKGSDPTRRRSGRVHFDNQVDVMCRPIGEDYDSGERCQSKVVPLNWTSK